jgi:hypothetical protein
MPESGRWPLAPEGRDGLSSLRRAIRSASGAARPESKCLARLGEVGFDPRRFGGFGPDRRDCSVRVCENLDEADGGGIRDAERAERGWN